MPSLHRAAAAAAVMLFTASPAVAPAQTQLLDFDTWPINVPYGSIPGVLSVGFQYRGGGFGNTNVIGSGVLTWYGPEFAGAYGVVSIPTPGYTPEIDLTPLAGGIVDISSLTFASWQGVPRSSSAYIWDANWNGLWSASFTVGASPLTLHPNVSSASGLIFQWDATVFGDVGLDAMTVGVTAPTTTTTPEPATWTLLGTGLLSLGWLARRRARA